MGQFSVGFLDSIAKLRTQSEALAAMSAPVHGFDWKRRSGSRFQEAAQIVERYGSDVAEAAIPPQAGRDFIWLGIIDWGYRTQRPQHLSTHLADLGNRILYISIAIEGADSDGRFRILQSPHPGVFEVRLRIESDIPQNIYRGFTKAQIVEINIALSEACAVLGVRAPVIVVQYPSWLPVAISLPGATLVYDCLDLMSGFANVPPTVLALERELIEQADLIVVASQPLADHLQAQRSSVVVRNAAEVDFFANPASWHNPSPGTVIGYFGAIAEWFASDWVVSCARAHPEWRFVIIGELAGADLAEAKLVPNIDLMGEKPYSELPTHLSGFDVAIIPFKLTELIEHVNPVKLYEYMAQGKPVVSCAMPEVIQATDLAYIARDANEFEQKIVEALRDDSPGLRDRRQAWALEHTWASRAGAFERAVKDATPLVSVIVLSYNSLSLCRACLHSLLTLSDYPSLEVIVVDNASTDGTPAFLRELALRDDRVRLILNDSNVGFAAGNNIGLREATGEYVVLLNNDTYVTRGWIRDLIRPLMLDPALGLVGPLTNNIGNEQKLSVSYTSMADMALTAREVTRARSRNRFSVDSVAFFCAAMRRSLLDSVGFLDEIYGMGFYEDDDYCKRVLAAGFGIAIADDVFIHHELSASFGKLPSEAKLALMERNKAIFEQKWGPWKPHRYRDEAGFGL